MVNRYINQLQEKINSQEKIIQAYREGISLLEFYLSLPKFYAPENHVNIEDIRLRLNETKQNVNNLDI